MKPNLNKNPHDLLLRFTLSFRSAAKEFVQQFLPKDVSAAIDLRTLRLEKDSFINENLKEYFSDILLSCKCKGVEMYISLLVEHKSFAPKYPVLQLLRYQIESYIQQSNNKGKGLIFRPIIPIILYHGKQKWRRDRFKEEFGEAFAKFSSYIPLTEYILIDLSTMADEKLLKGEQFLSRTLLLLKYYRNKSHILENLLVWLLGLKGDKPKEQYFSYTKTLFIYLSMTQKFQRHENEIIMEAKSLYYGQKGFKSSAEIWFKEGLEKGIKRGIEKGVEKGLEEGVVSELQRTIRVIAKKFPKFSNDQIAELLEIEARLVRQVLKK